MNNRALIATRREQMSMVFQSFALLPHKTVAENTAFGLGVSGHNRAQQRAQVLNALEAVGLQAVADSYPDELSGGAANVRSGLIDRQVAPSLVLDTNR